MLERIVTISNKLGLHARAASKLVKVANQFEAHLKIQIGERVVDGKSIMSVMLLAATQGTDILLRTDGRDEVEAMSAVVALIDDKFGEGT